MLTALVGFALGVLVGKVGVKGILAWVKAEAATVQKKQ